MSHLWTIDTAIDTAINREFSSSSRAGHGDVSVLQARDGDSKRTGNKMVGLYWTIPDENGW